MISKNIFSKFDRDFDVKSLKEELKNVGTGEGQFKEVPFGSYDVKLELVQSKAGKPMLSCWMKILSGDYKNSVLFMNQVVNTAYGLHVACEFLRSLESDVDVAFENFGQFSGLILDIHECINGDFEYRVEYGETGKGYKTFKITEIFGV